MTSSSAASRPPDAAPEIVLSDYEPEESGEALELERAATQGSAYRLAFRRDAFHLRAEGFAVRRIRTARVGSLLAGVGAVALKEAEYLGRRVRAAFFFDFRVRPELRGLGVGRRLVVDLLAWATPRSDLSYSYVMGDNRRASRVGRLFGYEAGGYSYLVLPTAACRGNGAALSPASVEEVHASARRAGEPFDLYSNPLSEGRTRPHAGSWLSRPADGPSGVSAWSTRGILEEVVVSLPAPLRAARTLLRRLPRSLSGGVRLPEDGEALRSWYLFDLFAPTPVAARDLLRSVARAARDRGIDWLYLPHAPGDSLLAAARADAPRLLSPVVPYRLFLRNGDGSRPERVGRLYVDPRDL